MSLRPYLDFARALITRNRIIYGHFAVTHVCNLRCRMCSTWKLAAPEEQVDLDGVREVAAVLRRLGCIHVSLGGGEPFMREDLPDIVRIFRRNEIRVRVLTNGVAPSRESIRAVIGAGLTDVSISFDTLNPELQGRIDGDPSSWRRKLETIAAFSRWLPRRGSLPILNAVISSINLEEAPALVEFADRVGFFVSLIPVHLAEGEEDDRFHAAAPEMAVGEELRARVHAVYDQLIRSKRRQGHVLNSLPFIEQSRRFLAEGAMDWRCDAGALYVSIGPDGKFAVCHDYEDQGLAPAEFLRLYQSGEYRAARARAVAECSGCVRPCWAEVTHLVRDPRTFLENLLRQFSLPRSRRPAWDPEQLAEIAAEVRRSAGAPTEGAPRAAAPERAPRG